MRLISLLVTTSLIGPALFPISSDASVRTRSQELDPQSAMSVMPHSELAEPLLIALDIGYQEGNDPEQLLPSSRLHIGGGEKWSTDSVAVDSFFVDSPITPETQILSSYSDDAVIAQAQSASLYYRGRFSQGTTQRTQYVGDCPGWSGWGYWSGVTFFTAATPPAPGRRVLLTNQRTGGYTDRSYEKGNRSESFKVALGSGHRKRHFTVSSGTNVIDFEIKERGEVIDSGTVTLDIKTKVNERTRNFSKTKEDAVCFGEENLAEEKRTSLDLCEGGLIKVQKLGYCSNNASWKVFDEDLIK